MIDPGTVRNVSDLRPLLDRFWDVSAQSLDQLQQHADLQGKLKLHYLGGK